MSEAELHEYYRNRNLLKAAVTGRHVGHAVLYFVSRQSPTTGATIPVDGGLPDATPTVVLNSKCKESLTQRRKDRTRILEH